MTASSRLERILLVCALGVPCAASLWLAMSPGAMSTSTLALVGSLLVATTALLINTWKNARAAVSPRAVVRSSGRS